MSDIHYIYIDSEDGRERTCPVRVEQSFTDALELTVEHPYETRRPQITVYFGNDAVMPETRIEYKGFDPADPENRVLVRFHDLHDGAGESGIVTVRP